MWILPNVGTSHIKIALYTVHLKCTVHSREWWSWMDAVNWPSTFAYLSIASSRVDAFWWMWTCDMKIFALIQVHSLASITKFLVFNLLFPDLWTTHQTILYCPWVFVYYKLRTLLTGSLLQLLAICGWYSNTELTHSWNNLVFFFFLSPLCGHISLPQCGQRCELRVTAVVDELWVWTICLCDLIVTSSHPNAQFWL